MSKARDLADGKFDTDTLVVDAANNRVGIGTASPDQKLTVASEGRLRLYRSDNTRYGDIYTDNSFLNIETSTDPIKFDGQSYIRFDTNSGEAMRIDSNRKLKMASGQRIELSGGELRLNRTDGGNYSKILNPEGASNASPLQLHSGAGLAIDISNAGYVTMPNQPSFSAYYPAKTSSGNTIVYGSTHYNTGSCYNTSNGRFTAPVAGKYFFTFSVLMGDSYTAAYHRVVFRVNGATTNYIYGDSLADKGGHTTYVSVSLSTMMSLSAGDYVTVYNEGLIPTYGTNYGQFGGFLIG